jgi:hypothetical protein
MEGARMSVKYEPRLGELVAVTWFGKVWPGIISEVIEGVVTTNELMENPPTKEQYHVAVMCGSRGIHTRMNLNAEIEPQENQISPFQDVYKQRIAALEAKLREIEVRLTRQGQTTTSGQPQTTRPAQPQAATRG